MASFWVSLTLGVIIALMGLGALAINTALEQIRVEPEANDNETVVIHMHVTLAIVIHGNDVIIPKDVGIDPLLYKTNELDKYGIKNPRIYPLHTHDTSGVIHIESMDIRTFTLGQFFDVWGKSFNENCILDKCNDGRNRIQMYVDGNESIDFNEHVLKDGELITIVYGFPAGEHEV